MGKLETNMMYRWVLIDGWTLKRIVNLFPLPPAPHIPEYIVFLRKHKYNG